MRSPLRIGEDIDIRFIAVSYRFGFLVHLNIFVRHVLEIDHPVVKQVLFSFRNQKMCLGHELRIQAYEALCMIHCLPACLIDGIHNNFIKLRRINTRFTLDTACCRITACYGTVIEQKNFRICRKSECLAILNRHIRYNCTGRIFSQFISFS